MNTVEDDVIDLIPAMRAYAYMLCRNRNDADDLVQDTLVKAIANIERYTPGTRLRAWLFTIMRNTFYNAVVKTGRERPGAADCVSANPTTDATQEWSIRGKELLAAVGRLPDHYRETLVLVVMMGESYEDTARLCGCGIGTVKSRVNRARRLVIEDLGDTPDATEG